MPLSSNHSMSSVCRQVRVSTRPCPLSTVCAVLNFRLNAVLHEPADLVVHRRLVALERDDVVRAALPDLADDLPLAARRVDGDDRALEAEEVEQSGIAVISLDFSSALTCPMTSLRAAREGAHDARHLPVLRQRPAEVLAVDRDDVAEDVGERLEPTRRSPR